jgi:SAM-dependent methyltransferase
VSDSVSFDHAAESYDRTRTITPEASAAMTGLLLDELGHRSPCLEIGVGTGAVALPLHAAGVGMVGVDLAVPMLHKLAEKAGGDAPFPLVVADATSLPFRDGAFGGALARHVLHLIPNWAEAVANLARVVRPGGVLLISVGVHGGPWQEVGDHLEDRVGAGVQRVGLHPKDVADLDSAISALGGRLRELPYVWQSSELTLAQYLREVRDRVYSWTWTVDDHTLAEALDRTRAWAIERYGTLDEVLEPRSPIAWRAYDLP